MGAMGDVLSPVDSSHHALQLLVECLACQVECPRVCLVDLNLANQWAPWGSEAVRLITNIRLPSAILNLRRCRYSLLHLPWASSRNRPSSSQAKSPSLLRCWQLPRLKNRSRCWESASFRSFSKRTRTWPVKSPVCCSKSTTLSCCTCWRTNRRSRRRWRKPSQSCKRIKRKSRRSKNERIKSESH